MHEYFDHVVDGQIRQYNIRRGGVFQGRQLGKLSPDSTYRAFGLWPVTGQPPAHDPAVQTCREITRTVDMENQVTLRQWEIDEKSVEDLRAKLKSACEAAIARHIQARVDAYNKANDLLLRDAYTCAQYAQSAGYTHQAFCQALWEWNVLVWESARDLLARAKSGEISINGPEDVIPMLPEWKEGE